jgi:hypothetical protein
MAAVAAGVIALGVALNLWGLVELEKLAYAVSAPFVAAGVKADERKVAEVVRLAEGALGKLPALAPGGGVLAEVERWVAGLRSEEVKAAVARAAEELEDMPTTPPAAPRGYAPRESAPRRRGGGPSTSSR